MWRRTIYQIRVLQEAHALSLNITALRSLDSILKQAPDKRAHSVSGTAPRPAHDNVRGASYFGENT